MSDKERGMDGGKAVKMWMMLGPAGSVAPFYGCAFKRSMLLSHIRAMGVKAQGCKPVRVTVMLPAKPLNRRLCAA